MRCERVTLVGDPENLAAALRALVPAPSSVTTTVTQIIAAVRREGDRALQRFTRELDTAGAPPLPLTVTEAELTTAARGLPAAIRSGLQTARDNIAAVARESTHEDQTIAVGAHEVTLRERPVDTAAVYVPGGRAPYPSTVLMGVIPAKVAGVEHVAVCTPPSARGDIDPVILGACRVAGATAVYRMGGAQAIAALAYGTESIESVEVIVGPGNLYVQEAKRQVYGQVGVDSFAGPSDLVVLAGEETDPQTLALDLLAQAEHGPGTLVVGITTAHDVVQRMQTRLKAAPDTGAIAALVTAPDAYAALQLAQALAPEHLQLVGDEFEPLAAQVTRAGCVFVGPASATAFGDYIAGPSHILPTGGAARYASAVTPATFRRRFAQVTIAPRAASDLARRAAPIARAEGFELHARSMEARIRDTGRVRDAGRSRANGPIRDNG